MAQSTTKSPHLRQAVGVLHAVDQFRQGLGDSRTKPPLRQAEQQSPLPLQALSPTFHSPRPKLLIGPFIQCFRQHRWLLHQFRHGRQPHVQPWPQHAFDPNPERLRQIPLILRLQLPSDVGHGSRQPLCRSVLQRELRQGEVYAGGAALQPQRQGVCQSTKRNESPCLGLVGTTNFPALRSAMALAAAVPVSLSWFVASLAAAPPFAAWRLRRHAQTPKGVTRP